MKKILYFIYVFVGVNFFNSSVSVDLQKFAHQLDAINKKLLRSEAQNMADDCSDLYNLGLDDSTSYFLQRFNKKVLCDMETDGGGWLVIQQRKKATKQVNFNRDWASYKEGFGNLDTEFWIGNEFLRRITNQKSYELRIDMEVFKYGTYYATYNEFRVGNEEYGYQLHIGGYGGNATDSLSVHNYEKFSTFDRDNDGWSNGSCAREYSGGFWFKSCGDVYLNGMFRTVSDIENSKLIKWNRNEGNLIFINVEMKIRPKKEHKVDEEGWLLIQRRKKLTNQVDFNRDWASYKQGFGNLYSEFWIGNEFLHRITNQKLYELRIDMEDLEKGRFYAAYTYFRVGNEASGYRLHIGGYQGNVEDQLSYHNNSKFSTFDRDNDGSPINCANLYSGAFWYYNIFCGNVYPNGRFPTVPYRDKVITWHNNGEDLILINVEMKIRLKKEQ